MTRARLLRLVAAAGLCAACGKKAPPQAVSELPEAKGLWSLGVEEVNAGRPEEAVPLWRRCLERDPANADCRAGLKLIEAKGLGSNMPGTRYTGAVLAGGDADAQAGVKQIEAGDYAGARESFARCLGQDPGNRQCLAGAKLAATQGSPSSERAVPPSAERAAMAGRSRAGPTAGTMAPAAPGPVQLTVPAVSESSKRSAYGHWAAGLMLFQKGDYAKARDEWYLCLSLDEANDDCRAGLARLEQTYGAEFMDTRRKP
ncbi:MAG: hypothetical protein A2X36_11620 [Elusimicrobia bacterium GWA2_69_24]|nr:MAG: hypothetical protein A2X36_11620 [Elusimicrobia bacterium GWA2_69_24]HBL17324.1 hypothetical protein [Elusimicrobiota bacterium]